MSETGVAAVFHRPQAGSYRRILDGPRGSGDGMLATYLDNEMTLLTTKRTGGGEGLADAGRGPGEPDERAAGGRRLATVDAAVDVECCARDEAVEFAGEEHRGAGHVSSATAAAEWDAGDGCAD